MGRRRWPWWKTLSAVLGSVVGLLALAVGWIAWRTNVAWAGLDERKQTLLHTELRRSVRRPILHSRTVSGNAWPHYLEAVESYQGTPFGRWKEEDFFGGDLTVEMQVRDEIRRNTAALAALGQGARSASLAYEDLASRIERRGGLSGRKVVFLACHDAWLKLEEGLDDQAAERILEVLQFGRDWAESAEYGEAFMYGEALYWAERPLLRLLGLPWLHSGTRKALLDALAALDDLPPDSTALLRRELISLMAGMPRQGFWAHMDEIRLRKTEVPSWQRVELWGRLLGLGMLRRREEFLDVHPPHAGQPWPEHLRTPAQRRDFVERGWLPDEAPVLDDLPYRDAQGRVRMLRMAALWLSGKTIEGLSDPYGGELRFVIRDRTLHVWSVGRNAVDDGGPDAVPNRKKDLLLTVARNP